MKPRIIIILLAVAAFAAKLYCAATTIGSSDVAFFYSYASTIRHSGLLAMYRETPFFNHTPLIGWMAEGCHVLSEGDKREFAFYLRLPAILSDLASVLALLWLREKTGRPGWWALGLYAACPVAFMVSGYHGNVDPVMALGILLAGMASAVDRPAWSGFFLGFACNIKIIPVLFFPVFILLWWERRKLRQFSIPLALTILVGWSYPLLTIPGIFLHNVLGYGSIWGVWGITYLLRLSNLPGLGGIVFQGLSPAQSAITSLLKLTIIATALILAWRNRKVAGLDVFRVLTLIWAVFFALAPGFGSQYLAWLLPCVLVSNERWFAALTVASSIALFVFYNAISGGHMPWMLGFTVHSIADQWAQALLLPWTVLCAYLGWNATVSWRRAKSAASLATQAA